MRFREKPIVEAWQWDETTTMRVSLEARGMVSSGYHGHVKRPDECTNFRMHADDGSMRVEKGDWIIRRANGEWDVCKSDMFTEIYEPVA